MAVLTEKYTGNADELLDEARKRFALSTDAEAENDSTGLDDLRFINGEQWPAKNRAEREAAGRPCLTLPILTQFIHQVLNDIRQNRPSIKVQGFDEKADPETADIFTGIIRHIQYNSNADVAYDTGAQQAIESGKGFWRVITDYCDETSDQQEILIKRIRNRFAVKFDPYCQEPDFSDAIWCFIGDDIPKDEFKRTWPTADVTGVNLDSVGNMGQWITDDTVKIVEYFRVLEEIKNGRKKRRVQWFKLSGADILDFREWPGKWIPVVPVLGEERDIGGKVYYKSLIHDAKDGQVLLNFWKSTEAEKLQKAPKAPYIIDPVAIAGYESWWAAANTADFPYLPARTYDDNGKALNPPNRIQFAPVSAGEAQAAQAAQQDIKAILGMYEADIGQDGNEKSGRAILARKASGNNNTFHFSDNQTRALRHTGRILVDLIPKIHDTAQIVRILGEDGKERMVKINEMFDQGGKSKEYNLGAGKYDVVVSAGPSYATKRDEMKEILLQMLQTVPKVGEVAPDLIVKAVEGPDELVKRLEKTLPPGLVDKLDEAGNPMPEGPDPQIQAMMQQAEMGMAQLQEQLAQVTQQLNDKQMEMDTKIREAQIKAAAEVEVAQIQAKGEIVEQLIQGQMQMQQVMGDMNQQIQGLGQVLEEMQAGPALPEYDAMVSAPFTEEQPLGGIIP